MEDGHISVPKSADKPSRTRGLKPPWKKGQPSANPGGRPKRKPIFEAIAAELDTDNARAIVRALIAAAKRKRPDVRAVEALRDSYEGKPIQSVEHTGELTIVSRRDAIAKRRAERITGDK